jgi:hypothetical protein
MQALVVYESMFGSTERIANSLSEGLRRHLSVSSVEVSHAPASIDEDVALLVVAAPTHAFGLSRPATRATAAEQTSFPLVSAAGGLREWLAGLTVTQAAQHSCVAAAVDTRYGMHWVPGSAARGAETRLRRLGLRIVATAETFWVARPPGQLLSGEVERAHRWGDALGRQVTQDPPLRSWSDTTATHRRIR